MYYHHNSATFAGDFNATYAQTIHSIQGCTIDRPVIVVDCEKMPAAELYTSLSQVTKLENLALVSSEKYNLDATQGLNETRKHLAQMQMAQPADDPKT